MTKYQKFTSSFLGSLVFEKTSTATIDSQCPAKVISLLYGNYSFVEEGSGTTALADLKSEIEFVYSNVLGEVLSKYNAVNELTKTKEYSRTENISQNNGEQKTINSYFDPKDATGNQAEQKNTGTTLAEIVNSTIGNFTEMKASESERLADFVLSNIDEIIYSNFIQFINVYGEIPDDSDFNCWRLRK